MAVKPLSRGVQQPIVFGNRNGVAAFPVVLNGFYVFHDFSHHRLDLVFLATTTSHRTELVLENEAADAAPHIGASVLFETEVDSSINAGIVDIIGNLFQTAVFEFNIRHRRSRESKRMEPGDKDELLLSVR